MNLKIVDTKLRIASCRYEELKKEFKVSNTVVFIYCHECDWIVFNENYKDFDIMVNFAQDYLEFDNEQRKLFYEGIPKSNLVLGFFHQLDCAIRIRRNMERRRKANILIQEEGAA